MKRQLSTLFVMLASIIILAHAVVPHHHHTKLCSSECLLECQSHLSESHAHGCSHKCCDPESQQHGDCQGGECLLGDANSTDALMPKDNSSAATPLPSLNLPPDFCCLAATLRSLSPENTESTHTYKPYTPPIYKGPGVSCALLRAPPFFQS